MVHCVAFAKVLYEHLFGVPEDDDDPPGRLSPSMISVCWEDVDLVWAQDPLKASFLEISEGVMPQFCCFSYLS